MAAEEGLGGPGAGCTIIKEVRQIIAFVEEVTGLPSRWNGSLLILEDGTGEARTAQMLSRIPSLAKKEWTLRSAKGQTAPRADAGHAAPEKKRAFFTPRSLKPPDWHGVCSM